MDIEWRELINDFNGLITEIVQRLSQHKVANSLSRDKKTINGWLKGASPSNPCDVAWVIRLALQNGIDLSRFQSYAPIYDFSSIWSYEQISGKEPVELSWLTNVKPPPTVKRSFCGLELDGPLGVASSPLLANDKWAVSILNLGFGLSTFKTKRTSSKQSWLPPYVAFVLDQPDLSTYDPADPIEVLVTFDRKDVRDSIPNLVNSIGVPSESPSAWQEMYERIKSHPRGRFVGISVMGDGTKPREIEKDFELAIQRAKDVAPPFIELNLSCPNLEKDAAIWAEYSLIRQICSKARKVLASTEVLLVIKLPQLPYGMIQDILKVAGKSIDAVAFQNTVRVRPITRDRDGKSHPAFTGRQFGGLSGPCTFGMTRRGLHQLIQIRESLKQEFRIIAIGGVSTPGHVVELLDAGADVVQACTAPMFDPFLAWKVRFHLKQFEHQISNQEALPMLQPRNQAEIESFRNALEAFAAINRRYPQRAVPYSVLQEKWNAWMEQQPGAPVGKAHRISSPRTFAQWMRDFT